MDELSKLYERQRAILNELSEISERIFVLKSQQLSNKKHIISFNDSILRVAWSDGEIKFSRRAYRRYYLLKSLWNSKHKRLSEDYVSNKIVRRPMATSNSVYLLVSRTSKELSDHGFPYTISIVNSHVVLTK